MSNEDKGENAKVSSTSFLNESFQEPSIRFSIRPIHHDIIRLLKEGKLQKEIVQILNISKGYCSKKVKQLVKWGLVKEVVRTTCRILTVNHTLYEQVSLDVAQGEAHLKSSEYLVNLHNYRYKFEITSNIPDSIGVKKGKLKNWGQDPEYGEMGAVSWQRTTKHIVFWLTNPVTRVIKDSEDLQRLKDSNLAIIIDSAKEFQRKYGIGLKLTNPIMVQKEVKVKNALLTKLTKGKTIHDTIFKSVYPEDGTPEFKDEIYVKNFIANQSLSNKKLSIMKRLDQLENNVMEVLEKQTGVLEKLVTPKQVTGPRPGVQDQDQDRGRMYG